MHLPQLHLYLVSQHHQQHPLEHQQHLLLPLVVVFLGSLLHPLRRLVPLQHHLGVELSVVQLQVVLTHSRKQLVVLQVGLLLLLLLVQVEGVLVGLWVPQVRALEHQLALVPAQHYGPCASSHLQVKAYGISFWWFCSVLDFENIVCKWPTLPVDCLVLITPSCMSPNFGASTRELRLCGYDESILSNSVMISQ